MSTSWFNLEREEVLNYFGTNLDSGLRDIQISERERQFGKNQLSQTKVRSAWIILWEQLASTMVVILLIAALISLYLHDIKDAAVIFAILIFNSALGFFQEYRAEHAIVALQKLSVPSVRVRRDFQIQAISAHQLVPGDLILLEVGGIVPADCRILESFTLQVQESALTGESLPIDKVFQRIEEKTVPLADQKNMAFMGTVISHGRGLGLVVATGMSTELGRIADLIQTISRTPTPLQKKLDQLGRKLALIALCVVALIFIQELWRGTEFHLVLLTAISIAVAAIPEGLPAVVTIALALGAQRMLKRNALIRKLSAVETLGAVSVICSDKTGTLTKNQMTVTEMRVAGKIVDFPQIKEISQESLILLLAVALCNDASIPSEYNAEPVLDSGGDPTETALLRAAAREAIIKKQVDRVFPRVGEIAFSSDSKVMTTIHRVCQEMLADVPALRNLEKFYQSPFLVVTKGAADKIVNICDLVLKENTFEPLSESERNQLLASQDEMARNGIRVLGVAFRPLEEFSSTAGVASSMIFIGLIGMIDPARPEAKHAVQTCKDAGIVTIMITGDHPLTAVSIAKDLGISSNEKVLTGLQLSALSSEELRETVKEVRVYARVSPEHKLKIVEALQRGGHVVAMTGDGVNDAPALKKAEIGVAMGKTGTDVAKDASDVVLLDDNFASIVSMVEEGRVIFENIRKFFKYLMTTNYAEIFVMLLCPLSGMPLPLSPLQILWLNLVTDGPPALALGVELADADIMKRAPRDNSQSLFSGGVGVHIAAVGTLMGVIALAIGYSYWLMYSPYGQTMVFLTLTLCQLAHVLAIRSGSAPFYESKLLSNKYMLSAVIASFLMQLAVVYIPFLQKIFNTKALPLNDFLISLASASVIFLAVELEKQIIRRKLKTTKD